MSEETKQQAIELRIIGPEPKMIFAMVDSEENEPADRIEMKSAKIEAFVNMSILSDETRLLIRKELGLV